jgi:hypothetical protein
MATEEECLVALCDLAARLSHVDPDELARHAVERTVSCHIRDLGVVFHTRIHPAGVDPFERAEGAGPPVQVKVSIDSDDLVAFSRDELSVAKAWASGRLTIDASFADLLRLSRLL